MKRNYYLLLTILFVSVFACKNTNDGNSEAAGEEVQTSFGEDFEVKDVITYDDLLVKLSEVDSIDNIVVEGTVDGVCQAKGCWMNVVSETNKEDEGLFVKFKDYGFFMPKDLTGKVVMKGNVYKEETSVEELRHYAEDEGKSAEEIAAITEPITEMKFMASGVKIAQ